MVFSKPGRTIFPLLPPYGTQDPNAADGRIIPINPYGITPFLGLRSRLSQVWINRWTILLLLILARVLIAISGLNSDMGSAKREALSACTSVESMGSAMASMPHYLSRGVNELTASSVEHAVHGLQTMLLMTLTGVEEILIFVINVMYQTYLCLITMAVRGTVHVAVGVLEDAADFLNSTIKEVGSDIHDAVDTFESGLNKFLDGINSVASAFGGSVPELNISDSLDKLDNAHLPSSIDQGLDKLNSSLPTFEEVSNFTENVLRFPFEQVKKLMNESMGHYTFDRSTLPIPAKEKMTFCDGNDGINSFFNGVADISSTAKKAFIAVLVIAAILVCIPVAWSELRRWRSMKDRSELVGSGTHDPMDVVYIVSRPYTAGAGIAAASHFSNSRRQILMRWVIAYATSLPALFVLCLGLAGLFSCLCQFILLRAVQKTVPELTAEVGEFAGQVVGKLQNTSETWATDANGAITNVSDGLNHDVFGWVNTSTTAVNDTLNTFVDKTTDVLNETFGGTILYEPIQDVFECLIGLKIAGIQKGLTWVHDHAHIDFPLLPKDTFSLGAQDSISDDSGDSSFLSNTGDETSNKITEVVMRVIHKIEDSIRTEAIISTVIVMIWVLVVLMGIARALMLFFFARDRSRGEGGGSAVNLQPVGAGVDPSGFFEVPLTARPKSEVQQPAPQYDYSSKAPVPNDTEIREMSDEKLGYRT